MADRYPKKRIVIKEEPKDISLPVPIADIQNRLNIAVTPNDAILDGNSISDASNKSTAVFVSSNAALNVDISDASDKNIITPLLETNPVSTDISDVQDSIRIQYPIQAPEISNDISDASTIHRVHIAPEHAEISAQISDSNNRSTIHNVAENGALSNDISDVGNVSRIHVQPQQSKMSNDISDAADIIRTQITTQSPEFPVDISEVSSLQRTQTPVKTPEFPVDISEAVSIQRIQTPRNAPDFPMDISDPGESSQEHRREFSFSDGAWFPKNDPLNIGPKNFSVLKNFRYTDGGIEGVGGFSHINTTALGKYIRSGIQLRTNYANQRSVILVQGTDSDYTDGIIATNEGTVPATSNFGTTAFVIIFPFNIIKFQSNVSTLSPVYTLLIPPATYNTCADLATILQTTMNAHAGLTQGGAASFMVSYDSTSKYFQISISAGTVKYENSGSTFGQYIGFTSDAGFDTVIESDTQVSNDDTLYTEESGATLARFAHLPNGNVGMCDGKANKIWAGDEMPIGAFLYFEQPTVEIDEDNDKLYFTSNPGGSSYIDIPNGTYSLSQLASAIRTQLNANATLTNGGALFTVSSVYAYDNNIFLGKLRITRSAGTIQFDYLNSDSAATCGFINNENVTASAYITTPTFYSGAPYLRNVYDYTRRMNNDIEDNNNIVGLQGDDARKFFMIGTLRPATAFNFTVYNTGWTSSGLLVYYFDGEKFVRCTQLSDTTSDLTTTGTVTIADTTSLHKPFYVNGYYQYFYYFVFDSGDTNISHVTATCPMSDIKDLWDGEYRTPTKFYFMTSDGSIHNPSEYTLEVATNSENRDTDGTLILNTAFKLDASNANDFIELLFDDPTCVIKFDLNNNEQTGTVVKFIVSYWNGASYTEATNVYDSLKNGNTLGGTTTPTNYYMRGGSGYIFFYVDPQYEEKSEIKGIPGYRYKISWDYDSNATDFNDAVIDKVSGVPRYRIMENIYTFPFQYRERAMWCGCISDDELHRVDYSKTKSAYAYNGDDSSKYNNNQSLFFGGKEPLTGAVELFNQYGLNLATGALFFKNNETYLLTGSTPTGDDVFKINKISGQIGCPAPLTITPAEVSFTDGSQPPANIVLWLSDKGPLMYYNSSMFIIPGVEPYFDPAYTNTCVDASYIARSAAWYDPTYREWDVVFPSDYGGTGLCDTWLVYDLVRRKWYQRITADLADFPQGGFIVEDTNGNKYVYCYTASGYLLRMEYNSSGLYDHTYGITNTAKTADILPSESMWDKTYVRRMKILYVSNTEGSLAINYYANGETTATAAVQSATSMAGSNRYVNIVKNVYDTTASQPHMVDGLSHAFQFEVKGATVTKPTLLGHGFQWLYSHEDVG